MTFSRSSLALGLVLALTACGNVRDDLGLGRSSPDEFAVVDRAPLSLPPEFTLRPPDPGAARPQEIDPSAHASTLLYGDSGITPEKSGLSPVEQAVSVQSGADKANSNIRQIIDHEAAQKVVGNEHLVDDLLWWKKDPAAGVALDAPAEAQRIKAAKAAGLPLNQGATPVIEREKSGWLGL